METTVFTGYISTPCGKDIHSKREADVGSGKSDLPGKEERKKPAFDAGGNGRRECPNKGYGITVMGYGLWVMGYGLRDKD